jgi:putative ABC transport system permease protein
MTSFFNFDNTIYLPIQTLQKKIKGTDFIQFAIYKIEDMNKLDATIAEATDYMRREHKITKPDDDDFAVNSIAEVKGILDKVFIIVNFLLIGLTSISLIVGGVGIMNVMYVAVAERTFEIGLRKAVGARGGDVLKQFLFEAIFLTAIGGIFGVIIGALLSYLISWIILQFGLSLQLSITWQAVAIGFGFSALAGLVFGIYPAKRAAELSPMEALRKE